MPPPSAGDLPDPEIEPGSPASHADSLFGKLNRDLNSIPLRMEACSLKGMTVPAFSEGHARPECCLGAGQGATHPQVKPRHPCTRDGRALSPLYEGWESPATPVRGMGEPRHPRTRDGRALSEQRSRLSKLSAPPGGGRPVPGLRRRTQEAEKPAFVTLWVRYDVHKYVTHKT